MPRHAAAAGPNAARSWPARLRHDAVPGAAVLVGAPPARRVSRRRDSAGPGGHPPDPPASRTAISRASGTTMRAAGRRASGTTTRAAGRRASGTTSREGGHEMNVTAVVVTYNRRHMLLESVAAVLAQSRAPDAVIVVDNASEDGTADAVRRAFPDVQLTELARNSGGAGGFAAGMALALAGPADLIWLMDDDTVPEPGALAALLAARDRMAAKARPPALVASRVLWTDGRAHPMNTPRPKPFAAKAERSAADAIGCVPIRSASFVSVLVDA